MVKKIDKEEWFEVFGKLPHGVHVVFIYEKKDDLLKVFSSYLKIGLEKNEMCIWPLAKGLTASKVKAVLKKKVLNLNDKIDKGQMRFVNQEEWYLKGKDFAIERVLKKWKLEVSKAVKDGFNGLRVCGDLWSMKIDWDVLKEYEEKATQIMHKHKIIALCAYPAAKLGLNKVIALVNAHSFTLVKREGAWKIEENLSLQSVRRMKMELEKKVKELEKFKKYAIGRELKMIELKRKIKETE